MKHKSIFTVLVLVALLLGAIAVTAQDEAPMRTGLRPDAPPYGIRGPYAVGTMELIMDNNEERPLPMTIWYPALNPDELEEENTYVMDYPPILHLEAYGHALLDAEPNIEDGPYPLLIHAHGFMGVRAGYLDLVEQLASRGFVVIAPDFVGATLSAAINEPDTFWSLLYQWTTDFGLVIDFAEGLNAEGIMAGVIDTENIAISGHSAGGFQALIAAGAQLDFPFLAEECENGLELNDCDLFVPYIEEIAQMFGLDEAPDGLLPSLYDERIDAVIGLAPNQITFGSEGLKAITIPTLYIVGSGDMSVPMERYYNGFSTLETDTAYMVVLDHASHGVFINDCDTVPSLVPNSFGICADPVWDRDRAHDIINHYTTAFLLWHLKGDDEAAMVYGDNMETMSGVEVIEK